MHQTYSPKPLDPQRLAAVYATRSTGDVGLKDYMQAHGVSTWPVASWGLKELTLLAFYFHPDLIVARAQAAAARTALEVAKSRPSWGIAPRVEHHSDRPPTDNTPWSLGFELEIPVFGSSRRAVLVEREQIAVETAELEVGYTAWQLRARVRDALLGLYSARRNLDLFEKEAQENEALLKLLQRRLQEGMASTGEVTTARLRATQARGEVETQKLAAERSLGVLSGALGVPLEITRALVLS
ncbi:MAG: TolC family protein, partial [Burkholderiales bacterium]